MSVISNAYDRFLAWLVKAFVYLFLGAIFITVLYWFYSGARGLINWIDPTIDGAALYESVPEGNGARKTCYYENGAQILHWPRVQDCPSLAPGIESIFDSTLHEQATDLLMAICLSGLLPELIKHQCIENKVYRKVQWLDNQGDIHESVVNAPRALNVQTDFYVVHKNQFRGKNHLCRPFDQENVSCFRILRPSK